jgi:hypothetical protein
MGREPMEAHTRQDREFGQMEDAIGISEKDDDLVAVFLLETLTPVSRVIDGLAVLHNQFGVVVLKP